MSDINFGCYLEKNLLEIAAITIQQDHLLFKWRLGVSGILE
jgi:hypothetical protein